LGATIDSDEDAATAARILDEVEAELVSVNKATEKLKTLLGIAVAALTVVTVATVAVAMEIWRQWRHETDEDKRAEWMGSVSSLDSYSEDHSDGEEQEYYDVVNDAYEQDNSLSRCRRRTDIST
jgi:hypothetical protein